MVIKLPTTIQPKIMIGDILKELSKIPGKSIDCIVTSPPYWQQRDYEVKNQIGNESTAEEYVQKIADIGDALKRVLNDKGAYFLNIGDKYIDKNMEMIPSRVAIEMQKRGWVIRNLIVWNKTNSMPSPIKDRFSNTWEPIYFFVKHTGNYTTPEYNFYLDRVRIPYRTQKQNRYLINQILTEKEFSKLPARLKNLNELPLYISNSEYEKLPYKLKMRRNGKYNGKFKTAKRVNLGASPGARVSIDGIYYAGPHRKAEPNELEIINFLREHRKKKDIALSELAEMIDVNLTTIEHWFRTDKGGRSLPNPDSWLKLRDVLGFSSKYDKIMTETHYKLQAIIRQEKGKNPGDVWDINTGKLKEAHFAIFPDDLPKMAIKATCPENGIVLDPFAGSGTTGKVAIELKRRSILIDINPKYKSIMERRWKGKMKRLTDYH